MTATLVSTGTRVCAKARCVTVVANELANVGLRITDHYKLTDGSFTNNLEVVLRGLRVWLAAQQLGSMCIEVFNTSGQLVRKWQLPIDYSESDTDEDQYETCFDELEAALKEDQPVALARYRVIVEHRVEKAIVVPGWKKVNLADDSHLTRRQVSANLVNTKHLRAGAFVYCEFAAQSGETQ